MKSKSSGIVGVIILLGIFFLVGSCFFLSSPTGISLMKQKVAASQTLTDTQQEVQKIYESEESNDTSYLALVVGDGIRADPGNIATFIVASEFHSQRPGLSFEIEVFSEPRATATIKTGESNVIVRVPSCDVVGDVFPDCTCSQVQEYLIYLIFKDTLGEVRLSQVDGNEIRSFLVVLEDTKENGAVSEEVFKYTLEKVAAAYERGFESNEELVESYNGTILEMQKSDDAKEAIVGASNAFGPAMFWGIAFAVLIVFILITKVLGRKGE